MSDNMELRYTEMSELGMGISVRANSTIFHDESDFQTIDIIDTPATMAVKSHLRNNKPVVIGISTVTSSFSKNTEKSGFLSDALSVVVSPMQGSLTWVTGNIADIFSFFLF